MESSNNSSKSRFKEKKRISRYLNNIKTEKISGDDWLMGEVGQQQEKSNSLLLETELHFVIFTRTDSKKEKKKLSFQKEPILIPNAYMYIIIIIIALQLMIYIGNFLKC